MKQYRALGSSKPTWSASVVLGLSLGLSGVAAAQESGEQEDTAPAAAASGQVSLGGGASGSAGADKAQAAPTADSSSQVEATPTAAPAEADAPPVAQTETAPASAVPGGDQADPNLPVPAYAGARTEHHEYTLRERYRSVPYMRRYAPEGNQWEAGFFAGAMFPSKDLNLKVTTLPDDSYLTTVQLGGRLAYYPLSFLGMEVEGWVGGSKLKDNGYSAALYGIRAHGILQLPLASIVPFLLVGGGVLGGVSETMGHDRDPAFHFGGGVKAALSHRVSLRLDGRDTMAQKRDAKNGKQVHNPEVQLGLTFTFERTAPVLAHSDVDYDGLYDDEDKCPNFGALTVDGCPTDGDGDGVIDTEDQCPAEAGEAPTGCPNKDLDGDGVPVPADQCPDEAGPAPTGCPDRDEDGDGFIGEDDKCPKAAEVRNGFEDDDGCPDEMPEDLKQFTGVIPGINFKQGTAQIEDASKQTLDAAAEILTKYPSIKIEVSGHTSSEGGDTRNQELSEQRANAVRDYFVEKGISGERVIARGAGSSEPIADNATKEGRQKNRRIEFRVLNQ